MDRLPVENLDHLERFHAAGHITATMLRAGKTFRDDWLASCRLAQRQGVKHGTKKGQPFVMLNWTSAAKERYLKAGQALGPWRPLVMWACCGGNPPEGQEGYPVESVRYALTVLLGFYRL